MPSRRWARPLLLLAGALVMGGCSQTGGSAATAGAGVSTTTAGSTGSPARPTTSPGHSAGTTTTRPQVELDTLRLLLSSATAAARTTFDATYKLSGKSTAITFAQQGTLTALSIGTSTSYGNGSSETVCDGGSPVTCYTGSKPLNGVLAVIIPADAAAALQAVVVGNVAVTLSSERRAGTISSCIAYRDQGFPVKYCLDAQGYLTFVKIPGGTFVRTSFSPAVPPAVLSPPAGAVYRPAAP